MSEPKTESGEKEFEASETRKKQAREDGSVVQSKEVTGLANVLGILCASVMLSAMTGKALFERFGALLYHADGFAADIFSAEGVRMSAWSQSVGLQILPLFLIMTALMLVTVTAMRSVTFSMKKIKPDLSRISPVSNFKKKYGGEGIIEFAKDCVKLVIAGILAALFMKQFSEDYFGASGIGAEAFAGFAFDEVQQIIVLFAVFQLALAAIDLPVQWRLHANRLKMTREELKKENKQSEGDPHLKQARRAKGAQIARGRMLKDVPSATVVMVNPEHYAVALRWDPESQRAPVVVAKGVDHLAGKIREIAMANNVPIYRDPPSTRSIYKLVDIDGEIRPEHFAAVAAAIQFVEALKRGGPKP